MMINYKIKASLKSEVNSRKNDNILLFSQKIFFVTYANKIITFASPASISCHFQTASFWVIKKENTISNGQKHNIIYIKMKTALAKFHFSSDCSSSY